MSDNGPYIQPPQFPQDGEGNSGGQQPPYGGAYGQPGHPQGGQDAGQHASGPYQAPYGAPGPGAGGQPGYGAQPGPGGPQFQHPQDQQMFQGGGQPPYGPGHPGGPVGTPGYPQPRKSNAGLWIVIGGGAVIVVLVIAVLAVVLRNTGGEEPAAAGSEPEAGADEQQEEQQEEQGGGEKEDADAGATGEPPYDLPDEPCDAISEDAQATYSLDNPNKSLTDNRASCSWSVDGEGDTYGTLRVEYDVPYAGSDSVEGAKTDFGRAVDIATDEDDSFTERQVEEEQDIDLGDEAKLVFGTERTIYNNSVATMMIRVENMNVKVTYSMTPGLGADDDAPAPLEFSDVEDLINDLGEQALNHVGS